MASRPSNRLRRGPRSPRQERAARRVTTILETAAAMIVDVGYEAVTMTGIAKGAGASVGALYDYFPDKAAVARVLIKQYAEEFQQYWKPLVEQTRTMTHESFAHHLIDHMLGFLRERPAYLPLLSAPIQYARVPAARRALQAAFAQAFRSRNPALNATEAAMTATIALQMIKGIAALYGDAGPRQKPLIIAEFKRMLVLYLVDNLRNRCPPENR